MTTADSTTITNGVQTSQTLSTPIKQVASTTYLATTSPALSSLSSVSSSRTKRFDERLRTRFSQLQVLFPNTQSPTRHSSSLNSELNLGGSRSSLKYVDLDTLNTQLYSGHSRIVYGDPTCVAPGEVLSIGTTKGYVLIFDYRQHLIHELGGIKALTCGKVTALALSQDSTCLAVGYETGDIFIWNFKSLSSPVAHIMHKEDVTVSEGHLKGSDVTSISFVGKRHSLIVSGDIKGMAFLHHAHRTVLGFNVSTKRLLGRYENVNLRTSTIFAADALPLGSAVQHSDNMGLVSILSLGALIVVSTEGVIRTQFTSGIPKIANQSLEPSGCQSWFPAYSLKSAEVQPAKLAYCFNNVLTILECKSVGDSLQFDAKKRWVCDESIAAVQWVNPSLLALITPTQRLILLNERSMKMVNEMDLLHKHILRIELGGTFGNRLNGSFKSFKGKLFIVGKYEFMIASPPNWMDVLVTLINRGEYTSAIETAGSYYIGGEDLEVLELPLDDTVRKPLVVNYLANIIRSSATHVIRTETGIGEYLHTAISALVRINVSEMVFEELYEVFQSNNHTKDFFEALEPFILMSQLRHLTPTILKDMVKYYIGIGRRETLEQCICLLDLETLDIDFTMKLLKNERLRDSYVFIWNKVLKDYVSPLLEFLEDIKRCEFHENDDARKVYGYLAYILTGRQYPTEEPIGSEAEDVKLTIYFILFNGVKVRLENGKIKTIDDSETEFPYLYQLLRADSKSFLSAMNECLEDSLLNDDEIVQYDQKLKVNRQFIMEVLIEIFQTQKFSELDKLEFAIFIARNYPKFKQFLRLGEGVLDKVIFQLCRFENDEDMKEDCKLSLQSLLSTYQPANKQNLIPVFENVKFYEILLQLYLSDRKFAKVLDVWTQPDFHKKSFIDTTNEMLEKCLSNTTGNNRERSELIEIIKLKFIEIIEFDTYKIVKTLNRYCPKLHKLVLDLQDQQLKYMYLKSLVELEKEGVYKLSSQERTQFIVTLSNLQFQEELVSFVKTLKITDFKLKDCASQLRDNECIDALIYLLRGDNQIAESLDELTTYISKLIDKLPLLVNNKDGLKQLELKIWKYVQIAITLCNSDRKEASEVDLNLTQSEEMWLKLINVIVEHLKRFESAIDDKAEKVLDVVKRLVQDLFSALINSRSQIQSFTEPDHTHQSSFLKIFTEFLNNSSVTVTLLGDVRAVTNEIYLSLNYEKNVLSITSHLINEGIYTDMAKLTERNSIGWSVKSFGCDACGKVIWGRGLSSEVYCKWEERQRGQEVGEGSKGDLVSFNCRHCYHRECLENLGNKDGYTCVICQR